MSKAKIVNECIKQLRAGMVPKLVAGPDVPSSRPDFLSVGRVVIDGRSCRIAGLSMTARKHATPPAGSLPDVKEHPVKMKRVSSTHSARGNQVSAAEQTDLQHWSELAHRAATILLGDPTIKELRCEWPTVEWVDEWGEVHTHRFDYYAVHFDGSESAFNVKHYTQKDEVDEVFKGLKGSNLGFRLVWVHEGLATDGRAANARSILKARQNYNHEDYVEALQTLVDIRGRVYLHQLLDRARNEADRREAIYLLIDAGVIEIVKPLERLADYNQVIVNRHFLAQELARHVKSAA